MIEGAIWAAKMQPETIHCFIDKSMSCFEVIATDRISDMATDRFMPSSTRRLVDP